MSDAMNGHVEARWEWMRDKVKRGDERVAQREERTQFAHIEVLLAKWGRWSIRCESGALGFASSCSLGGMGDGDAYDSAVPRGVVLDLDDIVAVDGAVRKLKDVRRVTVEQVFKFGQGRSDRENADKLGISREAMGRYLAQAYRDIALDIAEGFGQNPPQSVTGGSAPGRNQPVTA